METPLAHILNIARTLVRQQRERNGDVLTTALLRDCVNKSCGVLGITLEEPDTIRLVKELETIFTTWIDRPQTLEDNSNHVPWLPKKLAEIRWFYWDRYRQFLMEEGWAEATINKLDEITRDTLARLEDPSRKESWDRRGMVVGNVQSGKTSNYIGLISRAIDAGYKVVVVLAGIHNSLRSQTQIRLDEGLLGYDSVRNLPQNAREPVGVGKIHPGAKIDTITTRLEDGDFKLSVARQFNINPGGNPLLFVIKKNGGVLKNLLEWVEWAAGDSKTEDNRPLVRDVPLLVIDDESDHASIDTRKQLRNADGSIDEDHDPTVINGRIRQLLHFFEKKAYVGYTATPFANIYIHQLSYTSEYGEDLFPRHFITAIPSPSDYVGPSKIFGITSDPYTDIEEQQGLPVVRVVDDTHDWMPPGHKMDHQPTFAGHDSPPDSLLEALRAFILACAARRARGQTAKHNSMLIHVTRFVAVQSRVEQQIRRELTSLQHRLQKGDGNRKPSLLDELKTLWERDFVATSMAINDPECPPLSWQEVAPHLLVSTLAINIRQINGTAADVLDYIEHKETGLNVIAIGGERLSRGLTLYGLTVSYFLRMSRMYDTLMQMGRWFGYRQGYLDLCRLYTNADLCDWLRHITFANEELRQEFTQMEAVGGKPEDYGLKVRSHPDLLVTAPVKMRHGTELQISFSGSISETVTFNKDVKNNYKVTQDFLSRISAAGCGASTPIIKRFGEKDYKWEGPCWVDVPPAEVCRYLRNYQTPEQARRANSQRLADYIEKQYKSPRKDLTKWTIYVATGDGPGKNVGESKLKSVFRKWHPDISPDDIPNQPFYRIRRLLSPQDEFVDIDQEIWTKSMDLTRIVWEKDTRKNKRPTVPELPAGWAIRTFRPSTNGLLLIYPLEPDENKCISGKDGPPIIGIGISFPGNKNDQKISYVVNRIFVDQEYGD
jgi:hypothetical protein